MPKIVDSGVKKVMKTGKTKAQAYAIIVSSLKKAGELDNKGNLTALGKKRNAMTAKQRENNPIKKKKTFVKKLKRGDSRQSQEHLDLVEKSTGELDYAEFDRIATKWNNLVDSHIRELDKKSAEEHTDKLNKTNKKTDK